MITYSLLTLKEGLVVTEALHPHSAWIMAANLNLEPYDIFEGALNPTDN